MRDRDDLALPLLAVAVFVLMLILAYVGHAAQRELRRPPRHPDTVAHCLTGGLSPGQAARFEPCQNTQIYGRI